MRAGFWLVILFARQHAAPPPPPQTPATDWHGVYVVHVADAPELRIQLDPDGRFAYKLFTSPHAVQSHTGRWTVRDLAITLSPEVADGAPFPDVVAHWVGVRWGPRRYLVPEGRMVEFCNAVNLGAEPRRSADGGFPLAAGDWETPVSGRPDLPPEWRDYLLEEPLTGTLTEWLGEGYARMWIRDAGRLLGGMRFVFWDARGEAPRATSVKVLCPCEGNAKVMPVADWRSEVAWRARPLRMQRRSAAASAGDASNDDWAGDAAGRGHARDADDPDHAGNAPDRARVGGVSDAAHAGDQADAAHAGDASDAARAGDPSDAPPFDTGDLELGDFGSAVAVASPPAALSAIHFVTELAPWPGDFPRSAVAPSPTERERFMLEWSAAAARADQIVDGHVLADIARWAVDQTRDATLPQGWAARLTLTARSTTEDGRRILWTHETGDGPPLPSHADIVHRYIALAAVYDVDRGVIETLYVSIRGWVEE